MRITISAVLLILSTYSWGQIACDSLNIVSTGGSNQAFLEVSLNLCCLPGPIDSWTTTSNNGTVLGQDTMSITHNIHNLNPITTIPFDTLNTCLTYSWTSNNIMTCCVTWIWDGLNWINTNNVNAIEEINSTKKTLIKTVDISGKEIDESKIQNQIIIYLYSDGSSEKKFLNQNKSQY
jgi:hypothetical protein